MCPGMICTYVELARCYSGLGMFDEAARVLHQCVSLQPQCSPALVAVSVSILIHHYCFVMNIIAILLLFYSNHAYFLITLMSLCVGTAAGECGGREVQHHRGESRVGAGAG